jgi:hypothetical protein
MTHCHVEPFGFAQDRLRETSLALLFRNNSEVLRFAQNDIQKSGNCMRTLPLAQAFDNFGDNFSGAGNFFGSCLFA